MKKEDMEIVLALLKVPNPRQHPWSHFRDFIENTRKQPSKVI